jgi:tetratricopeptide (TPR) repeat protein
MEHPLDKTSSGGSNAERVRVETPAERRMREAIETHGLTEGLQSLLNLLAVGLDPSLKPIVHVAADIARNEDETASCMGLLSLVPLCLSAPAIAVRVLSVSSDLVRSFPNPTTRAGHLLVIARPMAAIGRIDEAKSLVSEALKDLEAPGWFRFDELINAAEVYWSLGSTQQALAVLEEAIRTQSTTCPLINVVRLYDSMGKAQEAESALAEGHKRAKEGGGPDSVECLEEIADFYTLKGKTQEAISVLTEALRSFPKLGLQPERGIKLMASTARKLIVLGQKEIAVNIFNQGQKTIQSLQSNIDKAATIAIGAKMWAELGIPDKAELALAEANIALDATDFDCSIALPAHPTCRIDGGPTSRFGNAHLEALNAIAETSVALGKREEAIAALKRFADLARAQLYYVSLILGRAIRLYAQLGMTGEAVATAEEALKALPSEEVPSPNDEVQSPCVAGPPNPWLQRIDGFLEICYAVAFLPEPILRTFIRKEIVPSTVVSQYDRIQSIYHAAKRVHEEKREAARILLQEAETLSRADGTDASTMSMGLRGVARTYREIGENNQAIPLLADAETIALSIADPLIEANILLIIADEYRFLSRIDDARRALNAAALTGTDFTKHLASPMSGSIQELLRLLPLESLGVPEALKVLVREMERRA